MSGRGRGRPSSSRSAEPGAGPSRRSTRQMQQQQQNAAHPEQPEREAQAQPAQNQEEQAQVQVQTPEPRYQQIIDPAIAGSQDAAMPPPPIPSFKNLQAPNRPLIARRGAPLDRSVRGGSMSSVVSVAGTTDAYSSQPEPPKTTLAHGRFGTPARAAHPMSEVEQSPSGKAARSRLMNAMLTRLFNACDDFFAHLCSQSEDAVMWEAERRGFRVPFDAYRDYYVSDITDFVVNPAFVVDTMKLATGTTLWHTVMKTVSAANLTSLFEDIVSIDRHTMLLPRLNKWNSVFPEFFFGDGLDNYDQWTNDQVIEQVLMIRTHISILTLQQRRENPAPFNPVEEVAKIWCEDTPSGGEVGAFLSRDNEDAIHLKGILASSGWAALARDRNVTRFSSICKMLPNDRIDGFNLDLSQLHETYSFDQFVDSLRDFVRDCFGRIKVSLQQNSSARDSLRPPAEDANARMDSPQIRSQLETEAMAHALSQAATGAPSGSYNVDALRKMKQMEQEVASQYSDSQQLTPSSYPRIPYPPGFSSQEMGYGEPAPQGGFQSNGSMYAASAAEVSGRKRRARNEPLPTGSDAGGLTAQPPKRARKSRIKKDTAAAAAPAQSSAPAGSIPHSQYPQPMVPEAQDGIDYEALSQRSRELSAANRKHKEPQVRSAWVRNDVRLLVKAVDSYECKWSAIEEAIKKGVIPFERPRNQQALRDKARLLKQDFLKADAVLPRGFDLVVLGKKEKNAVMAVGKNPERKEADVDENGQPINTELDPSVQQDHAVQQDNTVEQNHSVQQDMPLHPALSQAAPQPAPEPDMGPELQPQPPAQEATAA